MAGRAKDPEKKVGTAGYAAFVKRVLRQYAKAAAKSEVDINSLRQLQEIQILLDEQIVETVVALRTEEGGSHSWAQIGEALGISRQAALKRFGPTPGAARKVGGQPQLLR